MASRADFQGSPDVLDVDRALQELHRIDERQAIILEMRYFGGLSTAEIAHSLRLSNAAIKRDFVLARAWILRRLAHRIESTSFREA